MSFEDAVVPAIQVVIGSWVAMVTAGAAYLYVQNVRTIRALDEIKRRVEALDDLWPWTTRIGDSERLSPEALHEEADDDAPR